MPYLSMISSSHLSGLVTYYETILSWNESAHFVDRKYGISQIISHKFAHQWFGDLVTPKWWTYTWLNEGFANLFAHIAVDLVSPNTLRNIRYIMNNNNQPDAHL